MVKRGEATRVNVLPLNGLKDNPMDPNVTLDELRKLAADVLADDDDPACNDKDNSEAAYQMALRFDQLDAWMKKGGFSPWNR
jgi:hypothetical protein